MFTSAAAQPPETAPVAIYYGYPSLVNGARGDLSQAAAIFNQYQIVVLGDGLEFPSHADHTSVERLISRLSKTTIFGYVCIGSSQNLSAKEVQERVMAWRRTGAKGIFLDEAGRDFGVERSRLEQIIDFIHGQRLSVFVNAFDPDDVFADGSHLGSNDLYLIESFVVRMGELDKSILMNARIKKAIRYRSLFKVGLVGVTTTNSGFMPSLYDEACRSARRVELNGFGWGEPWFSSKSNTLSMASDCLASSDPKAGRDPRVREEQALVAGASR